MKEFKVGDRVSVAWWDGVFRGTIHSIAVPGHTYGSKPAVGSIQVNFSDGTFKWAHPRQCRRLVKRRRVWIDEPSLRKLYEPEGGQGMLEQGEVYASIKPMPRAIEFVEVRRRK